LKCNGTRAETRFLFSVKRTSPFKSAGASVQSTTGSQNVRISGSNAGYTMFRGSVKGIGFPFHSPVSPSLPSRASPCAIIFQLESSSSNSKSSSRIEKKKFLCFLTTFCTKLKDINPTVQMFYYVIKTDGPTDMASKIFFSRSTKNCLHTHSIQIARP